MAEPTVLLWDIGGVLLSNGFDEASRQSAAERFGLDFAELDRRHLEAMGPFERGEITSEQYLDRVVFHTSRSFPRTAFWSFVLGCSTPRPAVIDIARAASAHPGRLTACFNNESRELNEYRIQTFGLDRFLSLYFSSCYLGRRKPDPAAYQLVRDVLGRPPGEVLFIDDRPENLLPAAGLGFQTILYRTPAELRSDLAAAGVRL